MTGDGFWIALQCFLSFVVATTALGYFGIFKFFSEPPKWYGRVMFFMGFGLTTSLFAMIWLAGR